MNLKDVVAKEEIVVLVVSNKAYTKEILAISKQLCSSCEPLLYVSLNKLYDSLCRDFKKSNIDLNKFLFIDGISKSAGQAREDAENCLFVQSSGALTELSIVITKALKTGKFKGLIFDSLSTLLIYNQKDAVSKFVHSLVNKLKKQDMTVVFTALQGDTEKGLLKEIGLFVDSVVEYK